VTERKRLENERMDALAQTALMQQQRADEAEQFRLAQLRFVDIICHEIRNPLNGIVNNIDMLRQGRAQMKRLLVDSNLIPADVLPKVLLQLDKEEALWGAIELCITHQVHSHCFCLPKLLITLYQKQRRITDDVLHMSRLQSGRMTIQVANKQSLLVMIPHSRTC
jgi:signal transduction histidine kinase